MKNPFTIFLTCLSILLTANGQNKDKNDGLDLTHQSASLLSKAEPEVYDRMPVELKNLRLESSFIEIMSDDYNLGDQQESPSKIIYHNGWYHMWVINIPKGERTANGYSTTTYMNSKDGILWYDRGRLPLGKQGNFDDAQRGAADVIKYNDKFYLFYEPYTNNIKKFGQKRCGIAVLVSDEPEGPWRYATKELILEPSVDNPDAWDHLFVANPRVEHFNGKWYIYYKSRQKKGEKTKNGVATSQNLLGPYQKYKENPIVGGHSANLIRYKHGLIYMNYDRNAFYWTEDGFKFIKIKDFGPGTDMAEFMFWSTFWIPNNSLYGGDPNNSNPKELWGVGTRWVDRREGYGNRFLNNDLIGARLILKE